MEHASMHGLQEMMFSTMQILAKLSLEFHASVEIIYNKTYMHPI